MDETPRPAPPQRPAPPTFFRPGVLAVAALIVVVVTTASLLWLRSQNRVDSAVLFAGRDFRASPFVLTDAITLCQAEIAERHGDELVTSYVDDLSTRWNTRNKQYLIVVRAQLGDPDNHAETLLYCDIDPRTAELTYFKKHVLDERNFMQRAGNLFR